MFTAKQFFLTMLIVAIIFTGIGYIAGNINIPGWQKGEDTFQAGWEAAKKRLAESGFMPMAGDMEIKTIDGEILEKGKDSITLKIFPLEPLADPNLDNRTVKLDSNTKIYKFINKDQEQYRKEMEAFDEKNKEVMENPESAPGSLPLYPELFIKEEIDLAELQIGRRVTVQSADDIKDKKEFIAAEISAQEALPSAPAADMPAIPETENIPAP